MISCLVTGDDLDLQVPLLTAAGAAANVSGATSIKVALLTPNRSAVVAGPYLASEGYSGAAWATGLVVVPVSGADTTALAVELVEVEVEVIKDGRKTTYLGANRIQVIRGRIP